MLMPGIAHLGMLDGIYTTLPRPFVSHYFSDLKDVSVRSPFTALDHTLSILEPARMDSSIRSECLPGTRTDILQSITNWAYSTSVDKRLLWLRGLAGSGKSTLSTTIAHALQERGHLGAFVFFSRDVEERNQSANVIRTLACQLASFPIIRTAIAQVIDTIPGITQSALHFQFTKLLIEPLQTLPATEGPVVLILDALDECGSAKGRKPLLSLLSSEPVRILHPSFADFLSDRLRCGSDLWHIDTLLHNQLLAVHCISHLNTVLRRNICDLVLSQATVNEVLPEATSYACTSWIDHICFIMEEVNLVKDTLEQFFFRHLLHWLEAMSILKKSKTTITSVRCLSDWLHVRGPISAYEKQSDKIATAASTATNPAT
jgi:hypothetical protein